MKFNAIAASAALLLSYCPASYAFIQGAPPVQPFGRTASLLIGDSSSKSILIATDLDQDNQYQSPGEITVFFDPGIAVNPVTQMPFGAPGSPDVLAADRLGSIYVVYNSTAPVVIRLSDTNRDGDAMDPGESHVFLDGALAGLSLFTTRGFVIDVNGIAWLTADTLGIDYVVRFEDVNQNGVVHDPLESTIVYDDALAATNGNAPLFNISWLGQLRDGRLFATNTASFHQFLAVMADTSIPPDGRFDGVAEVAYAWSGTPPAPALKKCFCARTGLDGRMYLYNSTDNRMIVSDDANGNFVFDEAGEASIFFQTGDGGTTLGAAFVFDIASDGAVLLADRGSNRQVVRLEDINNDGDARDPLEQSVAIQFPLTAFPNVIPQSLLLLPELPSSYGVGGPGTPSSTPTIAFEPSGGLPYLQNATFTIAATDLPANASISLVYSPAPAAIPAFPLLPGLVPADAQFYINIFDAGTAAIDPVFAGAGGNVMIQVPLIVDPSIEGLVFYLQGLGIDPAGAVPIFFTNAISIPIL